jgi:hypothetical protein
MRSEVKIGERRCRSWGSRAKRSEPDNEEKPLSFKWMEQSLMSPAGLRAGGEMTMRAEASIVISGSLGTATVHETGDFLVFRIRNFHCGASNRRSGQ